MQIFLHVYIQYSILADSVLVTFSQLRDAKPAEKNKNAECHAGTLSPSAYRLKNPGEAPAIKSFHSRADSN